MAKKKLTKKVSNWLDETFKCPKCGEKDFSADLAEVTLIREKGTKAARVILVVCESCGLAQFFSEKSADLPPIVSDTQRQYGDPA